MFLKSAITPYGFITANLSINPHNSKSFKIRYNFKNIPITVFNPYLIYFTSFPMKKGIIGSTGKWDMDNGAILSNNHLSINNLQLGSRERNHASKWIPMRLVTALVLERGNIIDYNIPITGDLKNLNFHWEHIISESIKHIFIKPKNIIYSSEVMANENEIEEFLSLNWEIGISSLRPKQKEVVKKMTDFLKTHSSASIKVYSITYTEKEKEHILFFEAKKKYFMHSNNKVFLSYMDSIEIEKLSIKDPSFILFLNERLNNPMLFTIQQKCKAYINSNNINVKFEYLIRSRENTFRSFFRENGTQGQMQIYDNKSSIPFNGLSYYKINYFGAIPEHLLLAYKLRVRLKTEQIENGVSTLK